MGEIVQPTTTVFSHPLGRRLQCDLSATATTDAAAAAAAAADEDDETIHRSLRVNRITVANTPLSRRSTAC